MVGLLMTAIRLTSSGTTLPKWAKRPAPIWIGSCPPSVCTVTSVLIERPFYVLKNPSTLVPRGAPTPHLWYQKYNQPPTHTADRARRQARQCVPRDPLFATRDVIYHRPNDDTAHAPGRANRSPPLAR